jgi:catalase
MVANPTILLAIAGLSVVAAQCPFGHSGSSVQTPQHARRSGDSNAEELPHFIDKHIISDLTDDYLTSDVGGPIEDQGSLKASERGPTLLEDFVFRQKITHFDHERVCYRFP